MKATSPASRVLTLGLPTSNFAVLPLYRTTCPSLPVVSDALDRSAGATNAVTNLLEPALYLTRCPSDAPVVSRSAGPTRLGLKRFGVAVGSHRTNCPVDV